MQPSDESNDHFRVPAPESAVDAQREKFSAREVAQVLSHYDVGVISNIREYRRGSRRAPKLKLETERGEFMLKRKNAGHSRERAEAGHALQARAAAAGVPVAALVSMRNGGTLLALGDSLYEMYEWVQGARYERDPEQAREAGIALARLHRAFASLEPNGNLPTGGFSEIDAVRRSLLLADASACERLQGADREAVRASVASLDRHLERIERKLVERGLPLQRLSVCHGDYHPNT